MAAIIRRITKCGLKLKAAVKWRDTILKILEWYHWWLVLKN